METNTNKTGAMGTSFCSDARRELKAMGYRVKLSRRNGIRAEVEVTIVSANGAHIAGGANDAEALEGALTFARSNR